MKNVKGTHILLVEDDALIAMLQKKQLEQKGYAVDHVFNGEKAVEAALRPDAPYKVILMDIDLGKGIDGTEAAKRILEEEDIPVVFISAHTEPEIVEKTEKITSYGYAVKNSGIIVLDASIKMALKLFEEKKAGATMAHMLDVAPNSITVHDMDGNFLYANAKTFELHGYTEEEFLKINLHELDVPESEALIEERIQKIFTDGQATFETAHYRKDGSILPMEVSIKVVEWQGRQAVLSIATDITERKKSEWSLRESEERVQALLDANPDVMLLYDRTGHFIDCYASDEEKYLVEPRLFLGKHVSEVLPEYLAQLALEKHELMFTSGEPVTYYYQAERRGDLRYFENRLVPCGKDKALAIVRDITEEKRARDYKQNSQQWFQQAFAEAAPGFCFVDLKSRFIKVNDSLAAILGYSKEELLNLSFKDVTHPEDQHVGDQYFHRIMKGEMDNAIFKKRYIRKDGSVVHAMVATALVRNENNEPRHFVSQVVEVEEHELP